MLLCCLPVIGDVPGCDSAGRPVCGLDGGTLSRGILLFGVPRVVGLDRAAVVQCFRFARCRIPDYIGPVVPGPSVSTRSARITRSRLGRAIAAP